MISSRKKILMPIRRLTFASVAVAAMGFLYLDAASKNPAAAHQNHMQAGQVRAQKPSDSANAQVPVTTATVMIENFQFTPNKVVLKKGGQVKFINKDLAPHTATPDKKAKFTGTGVIPPNQSKTVVFTTVGVQNYFCEIHPSMKGKITVK